MPLYKFLKKSECFKWTLEAQQALKQLKSFLTSPSVLASWAKAETLFLYTAATSHTVSTALVVEHKEEGHTL
jgi:hypothetical protein